MLYHAAMQQADADHIVVEPVIGKAMLRDFIRFPQSVYRDDAQWVPPLMFERLQAFSPANPFFQHAQWQAWLARRGDQLVGRISAQIDRLFLQHQQAETGFFGSFEAVDDPAVMSALFGAAEGWLKSQGIRRVLGPFNLGINQEIGLLVSGHDAPPYFMMGHAPVYYPAGLERLGYAGVRDTLAYEVLAGGFVLPERIQRLLRRQKDKVRVRCLDRKHQRQELEAMRDIFNDAWSDNWGFVPFTHDEFHTMGKELLMLVPRDYIRIAEVGGEAAAFIVMLPNINEAIADLGGKLLPWNWARLIWRLKIKSPKTARVVLMGVRKQYQHTRLGPALAFLTIAALEQPARRRGIERVEMSWILEENQAMRNIIEQIGGRVTKRYRMYSKDLQ